MARKKRRRSLAEDLRAHRKSAMKSTAGTAEHKSKGYESPTATLGPENTPGTREYGQTHGHGNASPSTSSLASIEHSSNSSPASSNVGDTPQTVPGKHVVRPPVSSLAAIEASARPLGKRPEPIEAIITKREERQEKLRREPQVVPPLRQRTPRRDTPKAPLRQPSSLTALLGTKGQPQRPAPIPTTVPPSHNTERPVGQPGRNEPKPSLAEVKQAHHKVQQKKLAALGRKFPEIADSIPTIIRAAKDYDVDPSTLASIYGVETAHGANVQESSAGAQGPMQFLPSTFAQYGVDSPQDAGKTADIQSTPDSIASAANYLSKSGYKSDPRAAIFAYNHADWYVDQVVQGAKQYAALDRVAKGADGQLVEPPPKKVVSRFKAIVDEAKKIESAQLPYSYGAQHVTGKIPGPAKAGAYDCSSTVSRVLQAAGVPLQGALVSGDLATTSLLKDGPGAVTIYANDGHTFMKIGNRYFGTSHSNPGGGPGFIESSQMSPGYLDTFTVRHVPGMGQDIARRMGVRITPGGSGTNTGLVLGSGGTTATITNGVIKGKPGASDKPIRSELTQVTPISSPLAARAALPEGSVAASLQAQEATDELSGSQAAYIPRRRRR